MTQPVESDTRKLISVVIPAYNESDCVDELAPRPAYSVLGHDAWQHAGVAPIQAWTDALAASITTVVGG